MTIERDLFRLIRDSQITVFDGPLIKVDGLNTLLHVKRALVLFSDAPGANNNKIVVTNTLVNLATGQADIRITSDGNFPVTATGGTVTIGNNPILGFNRGEITVNGTKIDPANAVFTGSLIEATNGGTVTIDAP